MKCAYKALLVLLIVVTVGVWGCAQGTGPGPVSARIRDLEARYTKLEEDYRVTVAARDQARKTLAVLQQERSGLIQQIDRLRQVVKERDELRQQLVSRTGERDALHGQMIQFSKDLQSLLGRIDAATNNHVSTPVTSAAPELPAPAKS
ncbi:MAG: hypothetical protein IT429_06515 [Gemmataceae bacterium]|nr:hypothetical protein [Gemmataceae bacterium]